MKRMITIPVIVAVLSLVGAFPTVFAAHAVPFNGHMSGSGTATSQTSNVITATVYLEHLGKSNLVGTTTVTGQSTCGGFVGVETDIITAANGDEVFLSGTGVSCPASPTIFQDTVTFSITGGTGRFADATGLGITQTTINLTSQTTSTFTATISGTISF